VRPRMGWSWQSRKAPGVGRVGRGDATAQATSSGAMVGWSSASLSSTAASRACEARSLPALERVGAVSR